MPRRPHGKSFITSPLPYGCLYQWTDMVYQLQTNPFQSSLIYQTYSIRRQSPHFRRLSTPATSPIRSPSRRRLLWKTHHPRNWTRPRISRFHAWNPTFGTHLRRPNQHFPSPVTILCLTTESSSERFSISLSFCGQGCFSWILCSTRSWSINSSLYFGRGSQWGTQRFQLRFWLSIRTFSRKKIGLPWFVCFFHLLWPFFFSWFTCDFLFLTV